MNLSKREVEIIDLLLAGCRDREIAARLAIGTETVRTYVKRLLRKLGARNRLMAVAIYVLEERERARSILFQRP